MDARAWDERYAATGLVWSGSANQFVVDELTDLRPGRALDLAAGEGRNALWLAQRGWRVTAVDFSRVGLDKGRALAEEHGLDVEWVCADVLTFDAGRDTFDLVLLAYLQLVAEERRTAVRSAFTSLRPGGTFLLVAHDSTNLTEGTGGPSDPAVLLTAEEVLADLDGERFEVQRAERVPRLVQPDDAHRGTPARTAYDALVRLLRT
jgi:SAM-dependent methyltransferase